MKPETIYLLIADVILLTHFLFVAFVVLGLLLILIGKFLSWLWVRNPWFRWAHLLSIGIVVIQSWFGVICFLTKWENLFREKAGEMTYAGTFISYWLEELLYYQAPMWVFAVCYSVFGLLVILSWFWIRPRSFSKKN